MSKHVKKLHETADWLGEKGRRILRDDIRVAAFHLERVEKQLRIARRAMRQALDGDIYVAILRIENALDEIKAIKQAEVL